MQRVIARDGAVFISDVPEPAPPSNGYLVQGIWSLISRGTELSLIATTRDGSEVSLGYSLVGRVAEGGPAAPPLPPGQAVACAGYQWAWHAERVAMPRLMVTPVPEDVDLRDATFTTLGATAMHAVRRGQVTLGDRVVVIGLGVVGQLIAQVAKAGGAHVAGTDLLQSRCRTAVRLGADCVINPRQGDAVEVVYEWTEGLGADCVFLSTTGGEGVLELACELARDRGRIVVVGSADLHVPRQPFFSKELSLTIARAYGPGRYDPTYEEEGVDYPIGYVRWTQGRNRTEFLRLLANRAVEVRPLITNVFDLADAVAAYDHLREPSAALGVLLRLQDQV